MYWLAAPRTLAASVTPGIRRSPKSRIQAPAADIILSVTCSNCHHEIAPGTERTCLDKLKQCVRVCALCFAFLTSIVFGQASPTQAPPPLLMTVGSLTVNTNASGHMVGTAPFGPGEYKSVATLVPSVPPWASPEQSGAPQKLSRATFELSPADHTRLRSRKP